jgi:hypothetical protein
MKITVNDLYVISCIQLYKWLFLIDTLQECEYSQKCKTVLIPCWICLCFFNSYSYLFVCPLSHPCNIRHISYSLQFIHYNTTYNTWISAQFNIINNSTKSKGRLEMESVTTSRCMCTYINISKS